MIHHVVRFLSILFGCVLIFPEEASRAETTPVQAADCMPLLEDHTQMWWADGFPSHTSSAPWLRVIQTGTYAVAIDTQQLNVTHFGALASRIDYDALRGIDDQAWRQLPAAQLKMRISVDGKDYHATSGGTWSRFAGPRLIESGRFFQRADITDLTFTSDDGQQLNVEARFETAAWPDRLGLILAARPKPGQQWDAATMEISLTTAKGTLRQTWSLAKDETWTQNDWHEVSLPIDPVAFRIASDTSPITVQASELPSGKLRPVTFHAATGWHRVNLDGVEPIIPPGGAKRPPQVGPDRRNDSLERVRLRLSNPTDQPQVAQLLFAKGSGGIRQRVGSSITGVSAVLRDAAGHPTGIPVQLSKNWHNKAEGGVYSGTWFHGLSQLRLPANAAIELELTIAYGHWGGVPAASHAQLCLIGWGSNQHWSQSALGAWGESICFEPDQVQANCTITDVRPLMVSSGAPGQQWKWTSNVGGGDFFRMFDAAGQRVAHSAMRTLYHRHGPCLSEVTFAGRLGSGITHSSTVSLARTDDVVRGIYQIRLDVNRSTDFSRFVIFQTGADTYSYTGERKMALGNENGLVRQWETKWGDNTYRTAPIECTDRVTWVSLHEAVAREKSILGAWANRGAIIRSWDARLGGKKASPWIAERGLTLHRKGSSTLDILPPPGTDRLQPGDYVEATIEHVVMPQFAKDYYGPNESLRNALAKNENSWEMIYREAAGDDRQVEPSVGILKRLYPDVRIATESDRAEFTIRGGLGFVPVTFTGLTSNHPHTVTIDGVTVDQSVHGNDYWQTDYHAGTKTWSRTYNLPLKEDTGHVIRFARQP